MDHIAESDSMTQSGIPQVYPHIPNGSRESVVTEETLNIEESVTINSTTQR